MSTANVFSYFCVSCVGIYAGKYAMDTYGRQSADKHIHTTTQAPPSPIHPETRDASKTVGILNDLERLRQDQSDTMSYNDYTRMRALKGKFHDKLAESLQTALEKRRPINIAECRSRYDVDISFREGVERGSTLALARLAVGLKDYHVEGTSAVFKKDPMYPYNVDPAFKIPGTGKEMLEQLPKQIE